MEKGSGDYNLEEHVALERTINILQSGGRAEKIRALKDLEKMTADYDEIGLKDLYDRVGPSVTRAFQDPNEGCREYALNVSRGFIKRLYKDKTVLKNLLPTMYSRVCSESNSEASEELKLLYANYLIELIEKFEKDLVPYMEELVSMVVKLLSEPAPEIKKSASAASVALVLVLPAETFPFSKRIAPVLIFNLGHQHWRVRVATVKALEILMLKGDNKCVSDIINPVTKCLFDDSHHVRLAVTKLAGHWLLDLFDRYSFFSYLLPIILTSLNDQNEEIAIEARNLWDKAGRQYLLENEKDYKDRMNYEREYLEHYPKGVSRPGLGCRIIVEQEASKFVLALSNELGDWNESVRVMSSLLLVQYTLHAETSLTQSLHKIINAICKAAMDRESPAVIANVKLAAEYLGYFVPPETFCSLIVSHMKEANQGEMIIVASLVKGAQGNELRPFLPEVSSLLTITSYKGGEQDALLNLISSIFSTCGPMCLDIGDKIWAALISTAGLSAGELIHDKAIGLLDEFVNLGGGDKHKVFNAYCSTLLNSLLDVVWSAHCHQQFILSSLVDNGGEVIEGNLEIILIILKQAMAIGNDPEVILKVTMSINNLLSSQAKTLPSLISVKTFVTAVLKEMLLPHLKWNPGRSAEAIRTVACTCLYMCLLKVIHKETKTEIHSNEIVLETEAIEDASMQIENFDLSTMIPLILSLIEDSAFKTRIVALNCVKLLATSDQANETDQFYTIATNVIKRLEDAERKVREISLDTLKVLYDEHTKQPPERNHINKGLLEFVYTSLLIHLDDQEPAFRAKVLDCLKRIGIIDAPLLRQKIHLDKFRDKETCERLITYIDYHLSEKSISN